MDEKFLKEHGVIEQLIIMGNSLNLIVSIMFYDKVTIKQILKYKLNIC